MTYLSDIRTNIAEVNHAGRSVGCVFGLHGGIKKLEGFVVQGMGEGRVGLTEGRKSRGGTTGLEVCWIEGDKKEAWLSNFSRTYASLSPAFFPPSACLIFAIYD